MLSKLFKIPDVIMTARASREKSASLNLELVLAKDANEKDCASVLLSMINEIEKARPGTKKCLAHHINRDENVVMHISFQNIEDEGFNITPELSIRECTPYQVMYGTMHCMRSFCHRQDIDLLSLRSVLDEVINEDMEAINQDVH